MSLASTLTVLFVALKLIGVIDWSWFWVISPTLISISIVVLATIVYVVMKRNSIGQ